MWSERGLGWIEPDLGFAHLERLLHDRAVAAAVLPIDWTRFLAELPDGVDRDFFRSVAPSVGTVGPTPATGEPTVAPSSVVESWRTALPADRRRMVVAHLIERTRQVLGSDEPAVFDERQALKDVGLDSLMAVELRNVLTRSLGTSLPATLLFDYPSLDALARFVIGRVRPHAARSRAASRTRRADRRPEPTTLTTTWSGSLTPKPRPCSSPNSGNPRARDDR